ncbi:hypothetical protein PENSPDRAFT_327329 [Peniophora sp. CONT]|nr:hypothetical protein PENSPDRAFT_327329 [Peniophora sp. CONT]
MEELCGGRSTMVDKQMSEKDASSVISATRQSIIDSLQGFFARIHTPISACALPLGLLGFLFGSGACILSRSARRNVWRPETRSPAPVCFGRRCVSRAAYEAQLDYWKDANCTVPNPTSIDASAGHDLIHSVPRSYRRAPTPARTARRCRSRHPALCFCGPRWTMVSSCAYVYTEARPRVYVSQYGLYASSSSGARRSPPPLSPHLCCASRRSPMATSRRLVAQSPRPTWQSICYFLRPSRPSPALTPENPRSVWLESLVVLGPVYALYATQAPPRPSAAGTSCPYSRRGSHFCGRRHQHEDRIRVVP